MLHLSAMPQNRISRHKRKPYSLPRAPPTKSNAVCYGLSRLLAPKSESFCNDRWVRPCLVSTPLAPRSSRFQAWISGRSLDLHKFQARCDCNARSQDLSVRCTRAGCCSSDSRAIRYSRKGDGGVRSGVLRVLIGSSRSAISSLGEKSRHVQHSHLLERPSVSVLHVLRPILHNA